MAPSAIAARLVRLGGEYERASEARDYDRMVEIDQDIARLGDSLSEDYAWEILVIRGRNIVRRPRGLDELHI